VGHGAPSCKATPPTAYLVSGWKALTTTDRDVETLPGSCLLMRREDIQLDGDLLLYFPEDMLAWQHAHRPFRFVAGHASNISKSLARATGTPVASSSVMPSSSRISDLVMGQGLCCGGLRAPCG
jgi:hypothetical protein